MRYYVGQIELLDTSVYRTPELFSPVLIIGDVVYHYSSDQDRVSIASLRNLSGVHIAFNEDGEPSHGKFIDERSAWKRFLQIVKEIKRDAKDTGSISVGGLAVELDNQIPDLKSKT
jgi:hypothetical protein